MLSGADSSIGPFPLIRAVMGCGTVVAMMLKLFERQIGSSIKAKPSIREV